MERIRQALDRAREERAHFVGTSVNVVEALRPRDERTPTEAPTSRGPASRASAATLVDPDPAALERNRIVALGGPEPAARAFRMLRTQVLHRMEERGWRTIGVVSARSGDGKTTVAANLALALASVVDRHAVLLDLDLRRPAVARAFGIDAQRGTESFVLGEFELEDAEMDAGALRLRSVDRLTVYPARVPLPNSSELVAGPRCRGLLAAVRERHPSATVVVDLPPVLEADDATIVAPWLDCVLFVVAERGTQRDDVTRSLQLLARVPVVGTVLNRSREPSANDTYG